MPQQPIPPALKSHVKELGDFADKTRSLCLQMFDMFAVGLQVCSFFLVGESLEYMLIHLMQIPESEGGKEWFSGRHVQANGRTGSILRLLYVLNLASASVR